MNTCKDIKIIICIKCASSASDFSSLHCLKLLSISLLYPLVLESFMHVFILGINIILRFSHKINLIYTFIATICYHSNSSFLSAVLRLVTALCFFASVPSEWVLFLSTYFMSPPPTKWLSYFTYLYNLLQNWILLVTMTPSYLAKRAVFLRPRQKIYTLGLERWLNS